MKSSNFYELIKNKTGSKREEEIKVCLANNDLPEFLKPENFVAVSVKRKNQELTYFVSRDYFSIGTDDDYFITPATPTTLKAFLVDQNCCLPTPTMVEQIYAQAAFKLPARPQRPARGESLVSSRLYLEIDKAIKSDRTKRKVPQDALVAGHKKDVVLTNFLANPLYKNNVAIYGWYYEGGKRIQGLNAKDHTVDYVDYSHGLRFVREECLLDGKNISLLDVFSNRELCLFVHDEPLRFTSY